MTAPFDPAAPLTFVELLKARHRGQFDVLDRLIGDVAWRFRRTDDDVLAVIHDLSPYVAGERATADAWVKRIRSWLGTRQSRAALLGLDGVKRSDLQAARRHGDISARGFAEVRRENAQFTWTGGFRDTTPASDGESETFPALCALLLRVLADDAGVRCLEVNAFVASAAGADDTDLACIFDLPLRGVAALVSTGRDLLLARLDTGRKILVRHLLGERVIDIAVTLRMTRSAAAMALTRAIRAVRALMLTLDLA